MYSFHWSEATIIFCCFSATGESKIFYYKMKGDYLRYVAEFTTDKERKEAAENSLVAYKETQDVAATDLPPTHPIRSVILHNHSFLKSDTAQWFRRKIGPKLNL